MYHEKATSHWPRANLVYVAAILAVTVLTWMPTSTHCVGIYIAHLVSLGVRRVNVDPHLATPMRLRSNGS